MTHDPAKASGPERKPQRMSVIIPAANEAGRIGPCLDAVMGSEWTEDKPAPEVEIIVAANGCTDGTVAEAEIRKQSAKARGWYMQVLDLGPVGKLGALNAADEAAEGDIRVYLDADVIVSSAVLAELVRELDRPSARYASGQVNIPQPESSISRHYARFYWQVPFMTHGVPGCGLFAVNAAGRARWDVWPDIISDDTYVRLLFTPGERHGVPASYDWPIVEGWRQLVRVRQRQNAGVREIAERYPELLGHDDKITTSLGDKARMALRDPVGATIYGGVAIQVRIMDALGLGRNNRWARGR